MNSRDFLGPRSLLSIRSEMVEDLDIPDLPAEFEDVVDKPSKCGDIFVFNEGWYLFCCSLCERNFDKIENFIKHVEENHLKFVEDIISSPHSPGLDGSRRGDNDVVIDPKVDVEYVNMDILLPSSLSPVCDEWERSFQDEDSESERSETQDSKKDTRSTCEICGRKYYYSSSLQRHRKKEHPIGNATDQNSELGKSETNEKIETVAEKKRQNSNLACEICGKKFYSKPGLSRHKSKGHQIFKCHYCNRICRSNSTLVAHLQRHTEENPFRCPTCSKCFRGSSQLQQHQRMHTGERPHKCPHCPSAFSCRSNLLCHIRTHLGDKRYKCDQCGKCFVTSTELKTHIRSHTDERPYQCEHCGVKWKTASALLHHKKRVHLKYKPLACQTCGKRFLSGTILREHMTVHSNERPFECSICSATFPRRKTLISHLKIHSDVKEYVCKICGKEFAQGPGLYSHMKSHGINKTFKEPSETLHSDSCK